MSVAVDLAGSIHAVGSPPIREVAPYEDNLAFLTHKKAESK